MTIFSGCGSSNAPTESITHLPVRLDGDDDYSLMNIETGKVIFQDEFKYEPSVVSDDVFYTLNKDGLLEYHRIKNIDSDDPKIEDIPGEFVNGGPFFNGMAIVVAKNENIKAINEDGEVVFEIVGEKYKGIERVSGICVNNRIKFFDIEGRIGFLDEKGEVVIKAQFCKAENFKNGKSKVYRQSVDGKGEWLIIDNNGEILTNIKDVQYGDEIDGNYISKIKEDRYGIVSKDGEIITKFDKKIDYVKKLGDYIGFMRNDKWGLMDDEGNVLIRHKYDNIELLSKEKSLYLVGKDEEFKIVNTDDEEQFSGEGKFTSLENGNYFVEENKSVMLMNIEGEELCEDDLKKVEGINYLTGIIEGNTIKSDVYDKSTIKSFFSSIITKQSFLNLKLGSTPKSVYKIYKNASSSETKDTKTKSNVSDDKYVFTNDFNAVFRYCGFAFEDDDDSDNNADESVEEYGEAEAASEATYAVEDTDGYDYAEAAESSEPQFTFTDVAEDISSYANELRVYDSKLDAFTSVSYTFNFSNYLKEAKYKDFENEYYPKHVANVWNGSSKLRSVSGTISITFNSDKAEDVVKELKKSLTDNKWKKKGKDILTKDGVSLRLRASYNSISFKFSS